MLSLSNIKNRILTNYNITPNKMRKIDLRKICKDKDIHMAAYKLLNNLLLLLLIAFTGTIFAESLLPGIITSQIGFTSIALAIL